MLLDIATRLNISGHLTPEKMEEFEENLAIGLDKASIFLKSIESSGIDEYNSIYSKFISFIDAQNSESLDDLEDDIDKGFEFVTKDFLEKLEVKLIDEINDINFEDYKVKYIKDGNNIIIIFDDESKLIICNDNNGTQYHAIPAPVISVKSSEKKTLRKAIAAYTQELFTNGSSSWSNAFNQESKV